MLIYLRCPYELIRLWDLIQYNGVSASLKLGLKVFKHFFRRLTLPSNKDNEPVKLVSLLYEVSLKDYYSFNKMFGQNVASSMRSTFLH